VTINANPLKVPGLCNTTIPSLAEAELLASFAKAGKRGRFVILSCQF
jgi:hypothetical protein